MNDLQLILEVMKKNGFNDIFRNDVLELATAPNYTLSKHIKKLNPNDNTFLLSEKVEYEVLKRRNLNGAYGHLGKNGLVIPHNAINKKIFRHKNLSFSQKPTLNEFTTIVAPVQSYELLYTATLPHELFFGICLDKNDKTKDNKIKFYKQLINILNEYNINDYCLIHERYQDKEIFLVTEDKEDYTYSEKIYRKSKK